MQSFAYKLFMGAMKTSLWSLRRYDRWRAGNPEMRSAEEYRQSPYESYERMRERGTVIRSYANQGWFVNGFDEVQELLRDPRFSSDVRRNKFFHRILRVASNGLDIPLVDKPAMLNRDPPDHTRLRKLVAPGLINTYIQSLEPMIGELVDELLDSIPDQSEFDLIKSLAQPLPAMVIAEMMGVPKVERLLFQSWSEALMGATMIDQPQLIEKAARADKEMRAYLHQLVERKYSEPGADLISMLLNVEQQSDKLSRDELVSNCILLLTAGHETTSRLIGNGLYTLMRHPDQMQDLRDNPALMANAIEEMLRFESPIQMTIRFVAQSFWFHGHQFKKNQLIMVGIGAANRDAQANDSPETFDIRRKPIQHVAFGYGIHLCLGMALARLEGKIVFTRLLERFPLIRNVDGVPTWGSNPFFRGLASLRISTVGEEH